MTCRPTSITVIAWILIVLGVLGVLGSFASMILNNPAANERVAKRMANSPIPIPIQHALSFGGTVVELLCGYFLLRGRNWARYLYVIWTVTGLLIALVTSPMKIMLIPGVLIFAVITFFLFRPQANAFFAGGGANVDMQSMPSSRRIVSVICYVLAGFLFSCTSMMGFISLPFPSAKWFLLSFTLLPASVLLSIGGALSPGHWRMREVGSVFLVSAIAGAFMVLSMTLMFMETEFQKKMPPERLTFFDDYVAGALWIALLAAVGGLLLMVTRRQQRTPPIHAPIIGSVRR